MAKKDFKEYKKFLSSLPHSNQLDLSDPQKQYEHSQQFIVWKINNDILKQEFLLGALINNLRYLNQLKKEMEYCDELNNFSFDEEE